MIGILPGILHNDEVTIVTLSSGLPDNNGVPQETRTEKPWAPVNVHQTMASEEHDHANESTLTRWRVSGPPIDLDADDLIIWNGETFEIDGEPDTRTGDFRINRTVLFMTRARGARG